LTRQIRAVSASLFPVAVVVTLAWGAFSFGGVYPWAYRPLVGACVALGLAGLFLGSKWRNKLPKPLLTAVALVMVAESLQLVPLPRMVTRRVSPAADAVLRQHDLVYATDPTRPHPLSIEPEQGRLMLEFVFAFSIFFIGMTIALAEVSWQTLARGLIGLGATLALLGIVQKATLTREIYGFWPTEAPPFGPFINKNHFAGWMLMNLPVAFGYFCGLTLSDRQKRNWNWRRRVLWLAASEAHEILLVGAAVLVMAFALVMTLSRSGIGIFLVVLTMTGSFMTRSRRPRWTRQVAIASLSALGVFAVTWVGTDAVAARFLALPADLGGRVGIWRDALRILKDFPLTGSGLNTFGTAMLYYQSFDLPNYYPWAHNDYLQLAAEGGLLVGIPLAILVVLFVRQIRARLSEHTDWLVYGVRAGAVIGLVAIALQEFVDFSLQLPGNAALFSLLCALAVAPGPPMFFPPQDPRRHAGL
jgi:O-antigen ligase